MFFIDQRNVNGILNTGHVVLPPNEEFADGDKAYLFQFNGCRGRVAIVSKYGYMSVNQRKAVHYGNDNGYRLCGVSSSLTTNEVRDEESEICSTCFSLKRDEVKVRWWDDGQRQIDSVPYLADGVFQEGYGVRGLDDSSMRVSAYCERIVSKEVFRKCNVGFTRSLKVMKKDTPLQVMISQAPDCPFSTYVSDGARNVGLTVASLDAFIVSRRKSQSIVPVMTTYVWISIRTHTGIYAMPLTELGVEKVKKAGFQIPSFIYEALKIKEKMSELTPSMLQIATNESIACRKNKKRYVD